MYKLLVVALVAVTAVCAEKDKYVYTFAVGGSDRPYSYLDTPNGPLMGFQINMVNNVCELMEKTCKFFYMKEWIIGFDSMTERSTGLDNHYFDAAVGWVHTIERALGYSFDGAYQKAPTSNLYILRNSNNEGIDFKNDKIGFLQSWYTTPSCIERVMGGVFKKDNIVFSSSYDDLRDQLERGDLHAIFLPDRDEFLKGLKVLPTGHDSINCALGDTALMERKDEAGKLKWFGEGVKKLRESGKMERLCNSAQVVHGFDADLCL